MKENKIIEVKEFKRNICFSFFEDYRTTAKGIEEDLGKEAVADYYNAIIDYALYGIEPQLKGLIKYTWPTTKTTIDKSIENRSRGFNRENKEQSDAIIEYKEEHPEATQRAIAEAVGCSIGKVNKVLNKDITDNNTYTDSYTGTNTDTITNTSREREHEHVTHSHRSNNIDDFLSCFDSEDDESEDADLYCNGIPP